MSLLRLSVQLLSGLAGAFGSPRDPDKPTHAAGEPKPDQDAPHVDGPWFTPLGKGCIQFVSEWRESVWPAIGFDVAIPKGYVSDGYSIPRLAWLLVGHPFGQEHLIPAFVHDYLCDTASTYQQRVIADAVFFCLMAKYDVPYWKRVVFYVSVRFWGRYTMGAK